MTLRLVITISVFAVLGAAQNRLTINPSKLLDLTWDFDAKTVYWPTAKGFEFQKESWGITPRGYWYAAGRFAASEHGGTHIDSPIHFAQGEATTDKIRLSQLIAPAVRIDVSSQSSANRDLQVTAEDIIRAEKTNGAIPENSIVLIYTGWGRFWPDKKQYLGIDAAAVAENLHFPGISKDAATVLSNRRVAAVGIDTASIDYGQSRDFIAHQVLNRAGIYLLENLANLDKVPAHGSVVIALPMKIRGGSGGPVRVILSLP